MFLLVVLFVATTFSAIALQKTYAHLPVREVKRRARNGDEFDKLLYRAVGFGISLKVLLWVMVAVNASVLFIVLGKLLPWPLALLAIGAVLIAGFGWLPTTRVTGWNRRLVRLVTPPLAWVLNYLQPVLDRVGSWVRKRSPTLSHTGMYEKVDLIDLLIQQEQQADNRIAKEELDIAVHALSFSDKLVRDVLVPKSQVKMVKLTDAVGPVLLDELHASGHSRFPVYQENPEIIVGTLYLRDLVHKDQSGTVGQLARKEIFYIHEEQTLLEALRAFLKAKHHLFMVVNNFEEIIGILTLEDVLEQVIGKPIIDEFDQYEDLRAVAARHAQKIHKIQKHEEIAPSSSNSPEVVK